MRPRTSVLPVTIFGLVFILMSFAKLYPQNVKVFASAHPDDWQLFMNPNAYHDLERADNKVIFLHTTAGDAGQGTGDTSYYLAREEGSLRAIRFMCNAIDSELRLGKDMTISRVVVNGHTILRYEYANAIAYFLRLPDGNYRGQGYPPHDHQSLKHLRDGSKPEISAIDGSTTYGNLDDLRQTVVALIQSETDAAGDITINCAETDETLNPADHSDHLNTSYIMQDVARDLGLTSVRLFQEYSTKDKPINVTGADFLNCAGTWGATASGLSDSYHYSTWDDVHNAWIGRQYFREVLLSELKQD